MRYELTLDKAHEMCKKYKLKTPLQVTRIEKGMTNDVFLLDDVYVVKIATYYADLVDLGKENGVYNRLQKAHVPSPRVYGYDDSKTIIPYVYIILEKVKGFPLDDRWSSFSEEEKEALMVEMGQILAQIHLISFPQFGERFSDGQFQGPEKYKDFLKMYVAKILREVGQSGLLSQEKIEKTKFFFENTSLFDISIKSSLTHLGFNFSDFLVENGKIIGVIDWEWARSAHNEEDLAIFFYRVLKMDAKLIQTFRSSYEKVHKLDEEFERRLYLYNFLYYLRVLPQIVRWDHRPDKQKEYVEKVNELYTRIIA